MANYPDRARRGLERARGLIGRGDAIAAVAELVKVVAKVPKGTEAWAMLAQARVMAGDHAGANACFERVCVLAPESPESWLNRGCHLSALGRHADALPCYARALQAAGGDSPDALYRLATCYMELGQYAQALAGFRLYEDGYGASPELLFAVGVCAQAQQDSEAALGAYRRAQGLGASHYSLHLNMGVCCHDLGDYAGAADEARQALRFRPDDEIASFNLGTALLNGGHIAESTGVLAPLTMEAAQVSRLAALSYADPFDIGTLVAEHRSWGERAVASVGPQPVPVRSARAGRKLRLGFVSPDFRSHPVAFFVEALLGRIDRRRFELYLYFDAPNRDTTTDRFVQLADHWTDLHAVQSGERAATLIRDDEIDVLFDLAGHTSARIPMFAWRMAPVQASYAGYAATTGLPTMDYLLTDDWLDPPGLSGHQYVERLYSLGPCFATYSPPEPAGELPQRAVARRGEVVLGSVARLNKISDAAIEAWCAALQAVPQARLLLVSQGLTGASARAAMRARFTARGISAARLDIRPALPLAEYLALHDEIDVFLDTMPWSGHTTTMHGLWMGVPTVTVELGHHAGRFSTMVMRNLGLEECIAPDVESFGATVARLVANKSLLKRVRRDGRKMLLTSSLMDHEGLAARFMTACEAMWDARATA